MLQSIYEDEECVAHIWSASSAIARLESPVFCETYIASLSIQHAAKRGFELAESFVADEHVPFFYFLSETPRVARFPGS